MPLLHCETMATLIRPNGPTEEVTPVNGKKFTVEEVQRYGCHACSPAFRSIDFVRFRRRIAVIRWPHAAVVTENRVTTGGM
jgi:hypothetical protein